MGQEGQGDPEVPLVRGTATAFLLYFVGSSGCPEVWTSTGGGAGVGVAGGGVAAFLLRDLTVRPDPAALEDPRGRAAPGR